MSKAAIKAVAVRVVDAAGSAGGIDEVERIANYGWDGDVIVSTLPARRYEDHDDGLAAALSDVANETGLEEWQIMARWDDQRERSAIEVICVDRNIETAIINEARRVVESGRA
jgi:hypothetical protein